MIFQLAVHGTRTKNNWYISGDEICEELRGEAIFLRIGNQHTKFHSEALLEFGFHSKALLEFGKFWFFLGLEIENTSDFTEKRQE